MFSLGAYLFAYPSTNASPALEIRPGEPMPRPWAGLDHYLIGQEPYKERCISLAPCVALNPIGSYSLAQTTLDDGQ